MSCSASGLSLWCCNALSMNSLHLSAAPSSMLQANKSKAKAKHKSQQIAKTENQTELCISRCNTKGQTGKSQQLNSRQHKHPSLWEVRGRPLVLQQLQPESG